MPPSDNRGFKAIKGLTTQVVTAISDYKDEPVWMRQFRLTALKEYFAQALPKWGPDLGGINFADIYYFLTPQVSEKKRWQNLPAEIKQTYQALGIPEVEQKYLAGLKVQYDSGIVYGSLFKNLQKKGVIFASMEEAVKKYPALVKKYLGKLVSPADNKFAALNSAVWSGGVFIYVPAGVRINQPLQTYFRINAKKIGQFERTLIIAAENSSLNFIEGCTSPIYSPESLHAGVVEIYVNKSARVRYTTMQNWSNNVYNLVTKRAVVEKDGIMEWVDGNFGSCVTMKYPSAILKGEGAHADLLSLSLAGKNQSLDTGGKMIHLAAKTTSRILAKSISLKGGKSNFRGTVNIAFGAKDSRTKVTCNSLILDDNCEANTLPAMNIGEKNVIAEHEATVSKLNAQELLYLRSRGIDKNTAESLVVSGFIEPIVKELPFEYAIELNALIKQEMAGAVG